MVCDRQTDGWMHKQTDRKSDIEVGGPPKNYVLWPSHCLSVPALSWDAMLSIAKVEFKLIADSDMYLFFEKGMRGEIS